MFRCRMVGRRDESPESMIDVTYRQSAAEREVVAVLQKLYLCASVEFLMAVADFFLQVLPLSSSSGPSDRLPLRQTAEPRADAKTGESEREGKGGDGQRATGSAQPTAFT